MSQFSFLLSNLTFNEILGTRGRHNTSMVSVAEHIMTAVLHDRGVNTVIQSNVEYMPQRCESSNTETHAI